MRTSILYQLHSYRFDPTVPEPKRFREVYTSKNNMVRIYAVNNPSQKSKRYGYEHHAYPPALEPTLAMMNAFDRKREKDFL